MSVPLSQTHHHPSPLQTLAPHLLPHLPHSLPLLRRIQFHQSSPSAYVLATFPPIPSATPPSFSASYVDRTRAPETECWIFSTYEFPQTHNAPDQPQRTQHERTTQARAQLLALLYAISQLPSPNPLIIIGSLHESLLPFLSASDPAPQKVLTRNLQEARKASSPSTNDFGEASVLCGISIPYMKWLIAPPSPSCHPKHDPQPLPHGYTFCKVAREELALTMSRTDIPKTEATLAGLGSVGIRYAGSEEGGGEGEGGLIAWAFIGVDGSLTSLHVEPERRGKGLAKAVGRRLFQDLAEDPRAMGFSPVEDGDMVGMAHSDVALENLESAGVAKGLGAREGWKVRWVSVDLGMVEEAVSILEKANDGQSL